MGLLREFKEFALKGNVLDLAVAVIVGVEFGKIINSLIGDVIMPAIGSLGKVDFSQYKYVLIEATTKVVEGKTLEQAEVAIGFGKFITTVINFIILAFCVFLVVKAFNSAKKRFEKEKLPAPPAGPTTDQKLLMEIRDLLARG